MSYLRNDNISQHIEVYLSRYRFVHRNITYMLESIQSRMRFNNFFLLTSFLLLVGVFIGSIVFSTLKGVIILALILGASPYIYFRMKLIGLQMKTRIDFLPAVEVFYQYYLLSGHKNLRNVLKNSLDEQRIMYPMKPIFEQLYRNLSTNRNMDESLSIFTLSLGHIWADYYVHILRLGLTEGMDVSKNMKELILDMRKAQRADHVERNRLLEIRIANFTPLLFLIVFLSINFQINHKNAYYYYLIDASGRNMLLDALLLIFVSFIMGLYLSIKRM